jgi:hypothetical protein
VHGRKPEQKVSDLRRKGFVVGTHARDLVVSALSQCPLHIGQGADEANAALIDLIREGIFGIDLASRTGVAHLDRLQQFEFPLGTYEALEARERSNRRGIARLRLGRS